MSDKFTPEFIQQQREVYDDARARFSRAVDAVFENYPDALAEIERLREALVAAQNVIGEVVACCTYESEEQAKEGTYGISHTAFTKIDEFIRKYRDVLERM